MRKIYPGVVAALCALSAPASAQIAVTSARIGCMDMQKNGNLTTMVANACNTKETCSFKAPTEKEYKAAGVTARTRPYCTQGMEIVYHCGDNNFHTITVPGNAWDQPPAQLSCARSAAPNAVRGTPDVVHVRAARIGCMDVQTTPNITSMVGGACNGKTTCSFKAPTEKEYKAAGVKAGTRDWCTQGMEITYDCGRDDPRTVYVQGNAWDHPPAKLACAAVPPPAKFDAGEAPIKITSARIGCLDKQKEGNLTRLVASACNGRASCSYPAPTPDAYKKAGVKAETRTACTQAMEIKYRCGTNDDQVVLVEGDAWNHPPARLRCDGNTISTNRQDVTPAQAGPAEPPCTKTRILPPNYYIAPKLMLDWTPVPEAEVAEVMKHYLYNPDLFQALSGFIVPKAPTIDDYRTDQASLVKAPWVGGNEGRLRAELREVAKAKDPLGALCLAAQRFTSNKGKTATAPSDADFATAFADLAVTGRASFEKFTKLALDDAKLATHPKCAGASAASIAKALDRAYAVANAIRLDHLNAARRKLGWIAVSGEDDQPYRPVNVPSTKAQQFDIEVSVAKFKIPVKTRYAIFPKERPGVAPRKILVDGGKRKVMADPLPVLADNAEVILFIHGMDSKIEESEMLADALHALPGKRNWTVITMDLPSSGYGENIHHAKVSPVSAVACHNTPLVDFLEEYVVSFVDKLDGDLGGRLKPRIKAVVGGSLGGNLSMRLGRRPNTPWIKNVVPWSPAAIWPSMIAQRNAVAAGCDTSWQVLNDRGVDISLTWSGKDPFFLPEHEMQMFRRGTFYGGFDWPPAFGLGGDPPQAQCWYSDHYKCKREELAASRINRHETYDANYRAWHWRLAGEQLAFSHQQFADGTKTPLYLRNDKRMLLLCGYDDTCADLCKHTRDVSEKMVNTPGYARFMRLTGHSLDNEYPFWVARELDKFLE